MKIVIIVLTALLSVGCAVKPFKYEVSGLEKSSGVTVNDLRPQNEKDKALFSYLITSDAYGIYRNADTIIDPTPPRLFQHEVYEKFSSTHLPKSINLYHLVSYTNGKSGMRSAAAFGLIGALAKNNSADSSVSFVNPALFNRSEEDEYKRALYSANENPNNATVFIIYLDAEIDGKSIFIRKLSPVLPTKDGIDPYVAAVDSTIKAFLANY